MGLSWVFRGAYMLWRGCYLLPSFQKSAWFLDAHRALLHADFHDNFSFQWRSSISRGFSSLSSMRAHLHRSQPVPLFSASSVPPSLLDTPPFPHMWPRNQWALVAPMPAPTRHFAISSHKTRGCLVLCLFTQKDKDFWSWELSILRQEEEYIMWRNRLL